MHTLTKSLFLIIDKYLLMVYYVTSPVLGTGDRTVSGSVKVPGADTMRRNKQATMCDNTRAEHGIWFGGCRVEGGAGYYRGLKGDLWMRWYLGRDLDEAVSEWTMQASGEECSRQRDQKVQSSWAGMSCFDGGAVGAEWGVGAMVQSEIRELEGRGHVKVCRSWPGRTQIYSEGAQKGGGEISMTLLPWFGWAASGAQGYQPSLPAGLPCSAILRMVQSLSSKARPGTEGVGVLWGLLGAKGSVWQAITIPKSDKTGWVGVTFRSWFDKPGSHTFGVDRNMLVT